jgi:gliding motility-associated-like protein
MCYRVRAKDPATTRSSTSSRTCISPTFAPPPAYCYLRKATVVSENEISIIGYVDPLAVVSGYSLLRSGSPTGPYTVVGTQMVVGTSSISFTDVIEADKGPYYYYISTLDSCQREVFTSQVVQTMVLKAEANKDYTNELAWTPYDGWPNGVNGYNIILDMDGIVTTIPVTGLPFLFIDSVINHYYSSGKFCYSIEAVEAPGNIYFFNDSSRSNEVCVEQLPLIYIPNAFHPGGNLNEIFYPSNAFVPKDGYSFDIYNRWGELVFHTTNPHEGWNGSSHGKMAPEGIYVYRVVAKNGKAADIEKVGGVTLIR